MRRALIGLFVGAAFALLPAVAGARVLLVGSYQGIKGQYRSIQAAVSAAHANDWILVGPGDYKEHSGLVPTVRGELPSGVLITKAALHLRGMDRNSVVVDGTRPGSARCSSRQADQEFGPKGKGLNGIMVWKANNVWVQNLTVCNYLHGSGSTGNEIWWNGGNGEGKIGGWGFLGSYLNATSTFYDRTHKRTAAAYGIFSSNWSGGSWDHIYASNFDDSGFYIGACQMVCYQAVNHAWAQYNALGYSGTNAGGWLLIKNSQFDHNEDGFDTNSQNNEDWPSPQNGSCPHGVKPPVQGAPSCWVFTRNYVHDNNNPNVPAAGAAAAAPVGTGMSISGGRFDTILNNTFVHNNAWGTILVPYPDAETPPRRAPSCRGGQRSGGLCIYDDWGNFLFGNTYADNGDYGNQTNGDFAETTLTAGHRVNCYRGNRDTGGRLTSSPGTLQRTNHRCSRRASSPDSNPSFTKQVLCDSQVLAGATCPGAKYPRRTRVVMHPLPSASRLPTMPDPCANVPVNPWCPGPPRQTVVGYSVLGRAITATVIGSDAAPRKVLVVGCIHGNECAGLAITSSLAYSTPPPNVELWVVPEVNPDGTAADMRQNARGVDLNRNFPYRWQYVSDPTYYSGPYPLSEPESRAATRLISRVRPTVTIWYHQQEDLVDMSGGDRGVARRYAQVSGLRATCLAFLPGTATLWSNHAFPGTTAFVVELPRGPVNQTALANHLRAVAAMERGERSGSATSCSP